MSTATSTNNTDVNQNHCANCHTELLGPHCYACGQPVKGMVRHFSSVIGDFFDTLLAFDSRTWKTVPSLFFKPGFLTAEYFSGRRVRYVSPVRLFIFLCITSFFLTQINSDWAINFGNEKAKAVDVEEAGKGYNDAIENIRKGKEKHADNSYAVAILEDVEKDLISGQASLTGELHELNESLNKIDGEQGGSENLSKEQLASGLNETISEIDKEFLQIEWLPNPVEDWINSKVENAHKNVERVTDDPNRFKKAFLGALPSTLIVMLPIFAMMLWMLYIFKRRLYMEHLIVALHSQAFICLSILIGNLFYSISSQLEGYAFISSFLDSLMALLILWVPVYLFWMQKRVYQQGWIITLFKYSVLGLAYLILLSVGAALTVFWSLAEL
ncbi:hypothetical protein BTJ40_02135 [Microbulbifer sp. A4B17]|uniref:DUF3667 domain-containing protein n=1 Tax=Microbulbifer sp. A4B17 TaxID=359370 RepID=UPI000D52E7E5|nr:DUF3667 domain-containing protein [Microbulbifer sp. A4B17]AWF79721.1 hypothetical protein BTJ40_02135 [Microbulbifer sp. A4B17]